MEKRKDSDKKENLDQLNAENDPEFLKQFVNPVEIIFLSCKISKFNKYNWQQERNLIITNENIYNFKQKKVKRVIPIDKLAGLTKSLRSGSKEFVLHVKREYDYRLKSDIRDKILNAIKMAYTSKSKSNLPIYGIKNKELREFATTEKDIEKGISRIPLQLARIYEEDVIEEDPAEDERNASLSEPIEIMDNYTKNMARRSRAYSNRSSSNYKKQQVEPQELLNEKAECQTVFQRQFTDGEAKFDDFKILSVIGKGTFGKVYLVQHNITKKFYAMKSIRKDIVIDHDSIENLHLEKLILLQVNHPFIISMEFVFIRSLRIYFIMDFIRGGELFKHLSESKRFSEDRARFYAAQVALALGYLHKARIIYRDMKPENILLNHDGYILLADFGLAKINDVDGDEPNSFCAPEMIVGSGHDHTLDWWALGILIYEMIIGIPPFYNKNKHQMYYLIQHAPIRWPDKERHGISVSDEAKDLITRLLEKDRKKRLGQKNDIDEVLGHPFFQNIDIDKLIKKEIKAPFKPNIKSEYDLGNFEQLSVTESVLPEEGIMKINAKKDAFEKFGFTKIKMKVRIRLRNQGCKNHKFWWLLVQPAKKNLRGRYLEKVGYWIPRKTKTVQRAIILNKHRNGAQPTKGVHRLLEKFGFVPRYPVPFGFKSLYEKPEKEYNMEYHKSFGRGKGNHDIFIRSKIQEEMNLIERKRRLQLEVQENLGSADVAANGLANLEEIKTTDIESEEADIFERKNKFEVLLKRLEKHRKETAHLRGNDLRYNIYMRKINKLTRYDLGLDVEAYKDYINNLKQFAHVNHDFEIYARDSLKVNEYGMRQMIELEGEDSDFKNEQEKLNVKAQEILNTLRKLKRTTASYLNYKDRVNMDDFMKDLRTYVTQNLEIYEIVKSLYEKREEEKKKREQDQVFDIKKVSDSDLENANVSKREFDQIKLLLSVDKDLFKPSDYGTFSPYSNMIDLTKYGDSLPKEAKELLYRPPKVKILYEKYWQLANVTEGRVKEEKDRKILKEYHARYPQKNAEEIQYIDKILGQLDLLIGEDEREILRLREQRQDFESEQDEDVAKSTYEDLKNRIKGDLYYEGAGAEAVKKWNALTEEEKQAQRRGDEIDDIDTSEFEQGYDEEVDPVTFMDEHRINLARAFLGYDGGYSIRKLKKFIKQHKAGSIAYDENGEPILQKTEGTPELAEEGEDAAAVMDDEGEEEVVEKEEGDVSAQEEATKKKVQATESASETKATTPDGRIEEYSDESDFDETLFNMSDEDFQKMVEDAQGRNFESEEEAKKFFQDMLKAQRKKRFRDTRKKDPRDGKDPYYDMLKDEKADIQSKTVFFETRKGSQMITSQDDQFKLWDIVEKNIGRYPIGFRHFENFENYRIKYPDASIQDYHDDMNRQVEYDEFKEIAKTGYIQEAENPYFRWRRKFDINYPDTDESKLTPNEFVQTELFDQVMRAEYQKRVKQYLLDKSWYKLVDALEEVTNLWSYGRSVYHMPRHNIYVPAKQTIMPRPNLGDDRNDDTSYRFDVNRVTPYHYLNTLKGYKMNPPAGPLTKNENLFKQKKFAKFRRLSHSKMLGGFSTINQRTSDPAEEERHRKMWYLANFSNSLYGVTQNPVLYGEGTKFF